MGQRNERRAQQRRERKAAKRAERTTTRAPVSVPPVPSDASLVAAATALAAHGKISNQLIDFIDPLVDEFEAPPDAETLNGLLRVALIAWNSAMPGEDAHLAAVRDGFGRLGDAKKMAILLERFDFLVERRRTVFADDPRSVLDAQAFVKDGGFRVDATSAVL